MDEPTRTVKIGDFDPKRTFHVREWIRNRACHEFALFVDRKLPFGSADAYKEAGGRHGGRRGRGNPLLFAVNAARRNGWGNALCERKVALRRKYNLPQYVDVSPRFHHGAGIEPPNTYTGMFT